MVKVLGTLTLSVLFSLFAVAEIGKQRVYSLVPCKYLLVHYILVHIYGILTCIYAGINI
jgi:hypothetical protein